MKRLFVVVFLFGLAACFGDFAAPAPTIDTHKPTGKVLQCRGHVDMVCVELEPK